MGWDSLLIGAVFGFGVLLVFDAVVRPGARPDPKQWAKRIGPRGVGAISGAAVGFVATGWLVVTFAAGIVGWLVPSMLARSRRNRHQLQKVEAVADLAARLRDAIRSGIGIYDAIAQAAANPPSAIAPELRRLAADARVAGLGPAAETFAGRVGRDGELLASALALGEEAGARNTSDVLDALAEAALARAATLREARARQSRARVSARVVAAVPLILLVLIKRSNPGYLAPFDSAQGQVVLSIALMLIATGYLVMLRFARIEGKSA